MGGKRSDSHQNQQLNGEGIFIAASSPHKTNETILQRVVVDGMVPRVNPVKDSFLCRPFQSCRGCPFDAGNSPWTESEDSRLPNIPIQHNCRSLQTLRFNRVPWNPSPSVRIAIQGQRKIRRTSSSPTTSPPLILSSSFQRNPSPQLDFH